MFSRRWGSGAPSGEGGRCGSSTSPGTPRGCASRTGSRTATRSDAARRRVHPNTALELHKPPPRTTLRTRNAQLRPLRAQNTAAGGAMVLFSHRYTTKRLANSGALASVGIHRCCDLPQHVQSRSSFALEGAWRHRGGFSFRNQFILLVRRTLLDHCGRRVRKPGIAS